MNDMDEFTKDLLALTQKLDKGKHTKKFLRKEGSKLNKENKRQAKSRIGKKTGNFMKGFKRGKVYQYKGKTLAIRAINVSSHAHLLDQGYMATRGGKRGKGGTEIGQVDGFHFMEAAINAFGDEYVKDAEDFIDIMLEDHGL